MMSVSRSLLNMTGLLLLLALSGGCSPPAAPEETPAPTGLPTATPTLSSPAPINTSTPTPTPTPTPSVVPTLTATPTPTLAPAPILTATPTPEQESRCPGLNGALEVQVLAGPAEVVGLEPQGVGTVPLTVASAGPPYAVSGGGNITYNDMLAEEWGTYTVDMNLDLDVSGTCSGPAGAEQLDLTVMMSGNQLVTVDSPDFHGEYPWNGTVSQSATLPLVDGAFAGGEGWGFILHLTP